MKTYCVDIDGTILYTEFTENKYIVIKSNCFLIQCMLKWWDEGNKIIIHTGRHWNHMEDTIKQLKDHGVKYHTLVMGKPPADIYIDNNAIRPEELCY